MQKWVEETGEETLIVATADHAHTAQITYDNANTAGRVTQLTTVEGSTMAVNFATSKTNEDEEALGGQQHTGAQLRVAASGPGAANVTGQIDQTDLFFLVNNALGIESINHGLTFDTTMTPVGAQPEGDSEGSAQGSSITSPLLIAVLSISGIIGLLSLIALLFPFPVDEVLGPIAKR